MDRGTTWDVTRSEGNRNLVRAELPALPALDEGRFQVGREWARGGLGVVLEAEDRFLGRRLAVKQLIAPGDAAATARFVREALITARLQHPTVVPVYDAGVRGRGDPYYSMKLVSGRSLRDEIAAAGSLDDRLGLLSHVQAVADAIAYAHGEGVIHRDLKPSNVLVGPFGETVVIDWGLAKVADDDGVPAAADDPYELAADGVTRTGTVLGTPAYMPPEQARGEPVDERADVYAIGAMLYELLAGAPPYAESDSAATVRAVLGGPPPPVDRREPGTPRDLAAIVTKAMARDAADRYPDARALAADLKRFLTGQLVGARRYSRWALARRWVARHRAAVGVAAALLVVLALTAAVSARRIVRERDRATASNNRLRLQTAAGELARDPTAAIAWLASHRADAATLDRATDIAARALGAGVARHVLEVPGTTALAVCMTREGERVAAVNRDGDAWMWELATGTRWSLGSIGYRPSRCTFTRDGRFVLALPRKGDAHVARVPGAMQPLAAASEATSLALGHGDAAVIVGTRDGAINQIELDTGEVRELARLPEPTHWLAVSPDGATVAAAGHRGGVFAIDTATGAVRELARRQYPATGLAYAPDGQRLIHSGHDGVVLLELATGATWSPPADAGLGGVVIASFAVGGITISDSANQALWLWQPERGTLQRIADDVTHISPARNADGSRIVWTANDGGVHVLQAGARRGTPLIGHRGHVRALAMTADGDLFATAGEDGVVRVWQPQEVPPIAIEFADEWFYTAALPSRGALLGVSRDGRARLWTPRDRTVVGRELPALAVGQGIAVAVSPDERTVAVPDGSRCRIRLWDVATDASRDLDCDGPPIGAVAFAGDGVLITGGEDGAVRRWDLATGDSEVIGQHRMEVEGVRTSDDGRRVASAGLDGMHLIDLVGGGDLAVPSDFGMQFSHTFSPDGALIATGGADGALRLWDAATGEQRVLGRHRSAVMRVRWTARGDAVIAGDEGGRVVMWTLADGSARELVVHDAAVRGFALSPSGRLLASGDTTGLVRVVDLDTGAAAVLFGHDAPAFTARFVSDELLATNDVSGWLYLWSLDDALFVSRDPAELAARARAATTAVVGDDGVVLTPVTAAQ